MNPFEAKCKAALEKLGWTVLRNGWPDFLCVDHSTRFGRQGRICAVELKSTSDRLSDSQREMHKTLAMIGVPVHVLRPKDFTGKTKLRAKQVLFSGTVSDLEQNAKALERRAHALELEAKALREAISEVDAILDPGEFEEYAKRAQAHRELGHDVAVRVEATGRCVVE